MNRYRDPIAEEFFAHEDLEMAERVALAVLSGVKECKISFGDTILPRLRLVPDDGGAFFSYDSSIDYYIHLDRIAEKYPEDLAKVEETKIRMKQYTHRAHHIPRSEKYDGFDRIGAGWGGTWAGHSNPDFGRIVNEGTDGIRARIAECRQKNNSDSEWFYNACEKMMDALDVLGERFCALARDLAEKETDPANKKRYELAAKAFETVPKKPAYDFTSGCHAFWLVFALDGIDSPGRFDQYMYRVYAATEDEAEREDMMERHWNEMKAQRAWNLCLSGSDENWNDCTNPLTYHILRKAAEKKYNTPNLTLRVHRNTPEELWRAIADTVATGIGMPVLYNDEVVCPSLEALGIPPCHSHLYCMNGCNQIDIMGKSHMGLEDGEINLGKVLELALYNGHDINSDTRPSIMTGDVTKFTTYKEFETAFMAQLEYVIYVICNHANTAQQMRAIYGPNPLRSCLIEGCLEKGRDYRNAGPLYGHGQILAEGLADTGDSLYAVKKLVFDEKKYTMAELLEALKADFEGYDQLYRDFSGCEKFGCDIEEVDNITANIFNRMCIYLKRNRTYRGGIYTGGCSPFNRVAGHAKCVGALPNGKRKGSPVYADCIGATPGNNVHGPTALINSVLKYNHYNAASGMVFHTKFDKELFNTEKGKAVYITLAKTYFAGGGQQFATTVVSPEELLDAQVNPDQHRDLIVRVGGYSDYFTAIGKDLQDNVIARVMTEI